ncbi:MAG: MBL fold metallo-hydrolase [Balneolaceae bacterium]
MQSGRFEIEQLSEGFFEIFQDGTLQKMKPERLDNIRDDSSLGKHSSPIGIDPVYITDGEVHILLDAGLGWGLDHRSRYKNTSNTLTNLEIFGVKPEQIQFVVLSHLHYDHAAGSTRVNEHFKTEPVFPNARYILQSKEWEAAFENHDKPHTGPGAGYRMDELYKLAAEDRFHFIDDEFYELIPGIDLIRSGGHTPGHQIVRINGGEGTAYYMGDLIPTEYHLNHYAMKQLDQDPLQSKKFKILLLREAFNSGSYLYFYHSLFKKSGKLARDEDKKYVLLEE